MTNAKTFPEDFTSKPHDVLPGATQWLLFYDEESQPVMSVVGGASGLYGDGVTSFEMWDFREDEPQAYLSAEEINNHLKENPF
jgi:hypothetical protein